MRDGAEVAAKATSLISFHFSKIRVLVVHTCNSSTRETEAEECHESEASLGYIKSPCLKKQTGG